ncbi:MAG: ferrochelatase [Niveispirillum sp.]|uniref:ferrochelatase n=1 Tax=Niveispirillum sp. TaxID=1917217 RepID=UPI0040351949
MTASFRDRIAVVLMQPGQPAADGLVLPYLQALLAAQRQDPPSLPMRPLLGLRARRMARHFLLDDLTSPAEDPMGTELENALWGEGVVRVFTASLFAPPSPIAIAHDVAAFRPDRLVLLPPSPLFSGGLNGIALQAWDRAAKAAGLDVVASTLCCHPTDPALLRTLVTRAREVMVPGGAGSLLLVMPGLGWSGGDPLGWQMDRLAAELSRLLDLPAGRVDVARLDVTGFDDAGLPTVEQAIRRTRCPALSILPLSPWPLVRAGWGDYLDEWRDLAAASGILSLTLARPALAEGADLAPLVRQALAGRAGVCSGFGRRLCPDTHGHCPHKRMAVAAMHGQTMA